MERLNFSLPSFTRWCWTSIRAREIWEPRIKRIAESWCEIEWRSITGDLRACCALLARPKDFVARAGAWVKYGLGGLPLEVKGGDDSLNNRGDSPCGGPAQHTVLRIAVGKLHDLSIFKEVWDAGEDEEIARLLGFPPCCHAFYREVWVEQGLEDPIWPLALATTGSAGNSVLEAAPPAETNLLWRCLGLRMIPFVPCRFDCKKALELGSAYMQFARDSGYQEEMAWLAEILSWPAEWSALHGIAEIKTPILKISTRTDATAHKYVIRYKGSSYPREGARGLGFPYGPESSSAPLQPSRKTAPKPERKGILEATLEYIEHQNRCSRKIKSFQLSNYFTVIELDDGSVGMCMSYYHLSPAGLARFHEAITGLLVDDPLLLQLLFESALCDGILCRQELVAQALRATLISALSAPLISDPPENSFSVSSEAPPDNFAEAADAVVIGFGGYMEALVQSGHVVRLHIADLSYPVRQQEMNQTLQEYRRCQPKKEITISDGQDTQERMKGADLVSITASALCNGTLEGLLEAARGAGRVIVQGQSGCIYPRALFERGVDSVATTLKPQRLAALAQADPEGGLLRSFLDGGLPWIYLTPWGKDQTASN